MNASKQRKSAGNFWLPWIAALIYVGILGVFAVQTYDLVAWLFPATNWWMQVVTVFTFDGVALLCAMFEAFYTFRRRKSHHLVRGMWAGAFAGSCLATIFWMILSAATKLDFTVDPRVIDFAYGVVTVGFVAVIVLATFAFMGEYQAAHPRAAYEDDEEEDLFDAPSLPAPSNKFEDMQISPNTGPMPAMNGQIKKKQGGATPMTP